MRRALAPVLVALLAAAPLAAQTGGVIMGYVRDREGAPIQGAQVVVLGAQRSVATDSVGGYRIREVRSGWHRVLVRGIGYQVVYRDSVLVRAAQVTVVDFMLPWAPMELEPLHITAPVDVVLDPLAIATTQRVSAADLRHLPVTTLEEAVALSAGAVGESYRGGRLGQTAFIIDGLGLKNQLDASTGGLGLRIPADVLTEAALVTNGFSARYGQALSGLINVVTKDGGDRWAGRLAYESDRAFPEAWDLGLDRFVAQADGPLFGRVRFLGAIDATGRLDADPVNAPAPTDPFDPRTGRPGLLPHNSGEQVDAVTKLMIPVGAHHTVRLFGLHSVEQRLLYDPAYKYDARYAPGRRVTGNLVSGHWQYASRSTTSRSLIADFRLAYFAREFLRGTPTRETDYRFGAFTGRRLRVVGEDIARAQDTAAAAAAISGLDAPYLSERTPWGVPALFLGGGSRGELAWNRFSETRSQLDVNYGAGRDVDLYFGGEMVRQNVRTFQRALGYRPVGGDVPPAAAARFFPVTGAAYGEAQLRWEDMAFTFGVRYDRFDSRASLGDATSGRALGRHNFGPRLGISTVLRGATVVVSWGRFAQAPDYQYLVDAAFDDSTRTGRFRVGNPNLGFEASSQYEFSVRARPSPVTSLRINGYSKRLEGLVASVPFGLDPDSTIFGNTDFGTVQGVEVLWERELVGGWGARVSYTLQKAQATATNAFQLFRRIRLAPGGGDTIFPARVEFPLDYDRRQGVTAILQARVDDSTGPRVGGLRLVGGLEAAAIVRWSSGLPYTRTNAEGDTLIGLPNSYRLPSTSTVDLLVRRPLRLPGLAGSVYFDARNVLGRRNVIAVRRDSGEPGLGQQGIADAAEAAYAAHPEDIPYESPRYRPAADLDGNGVIGGREELFPLFLAAARDFYQPLFAYGPPRVVRLGVEVIF
ncbi:MAG: TonB-dependent receptor [Gemmatimonadetes bacterium]|nr:TonB-dependent receptor [Gemmatimonadota bacterium]